MTILAAYGDGKNGWLGIDSGIHRGGIIDTGSPKRPHRHQVQDRGGTSYDLLIGCCGAMAINNVLITMRPPGTSKNETVEQYLLKLSAYLHKTFVESALWETTKDNNAQTDTNVIDGIFVGVFRGRVFVMDGGFGFSIPERGFATAGSADHFALGALAVLNESGELADNPRDAIEKALRLCSEHVSGITGPFQIAALKES